MSMSSDCLFKFGSYEIPSTLIAEGGYEILPNQRQDLDPYTDQFGVTQRNALAHTKTQVTITTRKGLSWDEVSGLLTGLKNAYGNYRERSADCEYFDTETFTVKTGKFYLDPSYATKIRTYQHRDANGRLVKGKFEEISLIFIEF